MIDYRKMLIAYMGLIGEMEGIDYLGYTKAEHLDGLTDEEAVELAKIRDLGRADWNRCYDDDGNLIRERCLPRAPEK